MSDPYETLGLAPGADPAEVRRRYLELVRQFPPERDPERFSAVRAAYELLRDPVKRLESQLFDHSSSDMFDAMIADVRRRLRTERLPTSALPGLLERT